MEMQKQALTRRLEEIALAAGIAESQALFSYRRNQRDGVHPINPPAVCRNLTHGDAALIWRGARGVSLGGCNKQDCFV
jgi:hypothetical protein